METQEKGELSVVEVLTLRNQVTEHLKHIYGSEYNETFVDELMNLFQKYKDKAMFTTALSEKNVYLIAYGDSIKNEGETPLSVLHRFLNEVASDAITDVHLLPMFPSTSDDGFSVVDYRKINSEMGSWKDITNFSRDFRLMFDFVANHVSKSSDWFQGYLNDEQKYDSYFLEKTETFDKTDVVRPRTSSLFHEYQGKSGTKTAWTTFSEDQVDLNFSHFPVLLEMTEILFEFLQKGASSVRLDAIGFIWKESGTTCIHLSQAHEIIRLWRTLVGQAYPGVQLITETNVPHEENISYLGDGTDEAHMVYQFSLPPLVQYSFATKNGKKLTKWAQSITKVSDEATYFNFLASHDGIGLRPVEDLLTQEEMTTLLNKTEKNGGIISYKTNADGSTSPYELNINYMELLRDEEDSEDQLIKKMLAAHAILLSFIGVPAIYYHSLFGSKNDQKGAQESGIARRINREKLDYNVLKEELIQNNRRHHVFNGLKQLISIRQSSSAFSPYADQEVLSLDDRVFALVRRNEETNEEIFFVVNLTEEKVAIHPPFSGEEMINSSFVNGTLYLNSYEYSWIKKQ